MSHIDKLNNRWASLLIDAVNKKGIVSSAYSAFHNYSLGNQILAYEQCAERDIDISPINTYNGWKNLGRQVKKGAKAIELCMPVTRKSKKNSDAEEAEHEQVFKCFLFRKNWFLMSDTEGEEIEPPTLPDFDILKAMSALNIEQIDFAHPNGNISGYAMDRRIAISPLAPLPHKTRFHEMAHILLGHTAEAKQVDSIRTPKNIREVEAESVAYLLCSVFDLEGLEFSRGYIQGWLEADTIPEKSAQKIFAAANSILKAGQL